MLCEWQLKLIRRRAWMCLLTAGLIVPVLVSAGPVGDPMREAEQTLSGTRTEIRSILERMGTRPAGSAVRDARQQIMAAEPRPPSPGSLGGISASAPAVDVADLARRSPTAGAGGHTSSRLLVFISASVPRASLRRLARDAVLADATLVLRGVVGEGFPDTAAFMRDVLGGDEGPKARALIDPTLFTRYGVTTVPAMVLTPEGACVAGPRRCPESVPRHVHVAGDVTLAYALDYIARTRPAYREAAREVLVRLGGTS